jgi:hypothetical protein
MLTPSTIPGATSGLSCPIRARRTLCVVSASTVLGTALIVMAAALLVVGLLGWFQRLPRNRFAGIRTPATLRSDAAFAAGNRVGAPPVVAAGAICAVAGAVAFDAGRSVLVVIVGVAGAGVLALLVAGGLLGHRAASAVPAPASTAGCGGCACGAGGCGAAQV